MIGRCVHRTDSALRVALVREVRFEAIARALTALGPYLARGRTSALYYHRMLTFYDIFLRLFQIYSGTLP